MKFIIEMDSQETMDAIASGALSALLKGLDVQPEIKAADSTPCTVREPAPAIDPEVITAVPVEAPTYSMEQIAVAGAQLCDQGKRDAVVEVIRSFGASSLQEIPKEHYGAYAMKLRELGAKI